VLIVEMNVQFRLSQEVTNLFTAVTVSDKTNHKIQEMIDILEMIEVQDILEMIEVQDILEMIEVHILHLDENPIEIVLDLVNLEMINF
jgi:hypothetical protein